MSPMPRIHKGDTENVYFLSPTVVEWINIFTKRKYFEILADSLKYCIKNKGLILYEYVFMTNHIHLIAGVKDDEKHTTHLAGSMVAPGTSKSGDRALLAPRTTMEPAVEGMEPAVEGMEPTVWGLDGIIRDFKRYTTQEIKKILQKDNRKYILRLIKNSFKLKKGSDFQIWQKENYAVRLESDKFCNIKIQYIHQNPVKKDMY